MADQNRIEATQHFEPDSGESPANAAPGEHPQRITRYRIEKVLGKGGFGIVYLAHDEQLNRLVAVKVPHPQLISKPEVRWHTRVEQTVIQSGTSPGGMAAVVTEAHAPNPARPRSVPSLPRPRP